MNSKPAALRALLLCSVCTAPVHANEWDTRVGGYYNAMVAYGQTSGSGVGADFDGVDVFSNTEEFFRPSITLDNGIRIGADIQLEGEGTAGDIDESFVYIQGSFGRILIGNEHGASFYDRGRFAAPNAAIISLNSPSTPNYIAFDTCRGERFGDGQQPYFSPRFAGYRASGGYSQDIGSRSRGFLARDDVSIGGFVNPAIKFTPDYNGTQVGFGADFCVDIGRVLPTTLSLDFGSSWYSGSDFQQGLSFDNLGVTSPGGGITGVLINSPTDLSWANFSAERHGYGMSLNFEQPIRFNVDTGEKEAWVATPSGVGWIPIGRGPSFGTLSVVGGIDLGRLKQREMTEIHAFTPAFGANANWMADYHTSFDADVYGGNIGLSTSKTFAGRKGATNTFGVTGRLGYQFYDISVRDTVDATGLGGLLNFNNTQRHSFDEGVATAEVSAHYTWRKDNMAFTLNAGFDYGNVPTFNYIRRDSTATGAPLNPTLDLVPTTTFKIATGFRLDF